VSAERVAGDAAGIGRAAQVLLNGGLVVYPTETFYGLGALASHTEALARLTSAKLRPAGKPLPLLAADRAMLDPVVARWDPQADRLARRFWPGPLTLVLPARPGLPPEIAADGTVGVRVTAGKVAAALSRAAGGALVATSANLSGGESIADPAALDPALLGRVDLVVDGGPSPGGVASTVVAIGSGEPGLLREGAVSWDAIRQALTVKS
jgi:L-threonylcarbamoyladenylate synthase